MPSRTPALPRDVDLYRIQVRDIAEYAMFVIDLDGILQSWNAGVEKLFGYSEDEWIGAHASIIFSPADDARQVCEAEMNKAAEAGSATDIRWHRRKDGTELFANGIVKAIRDEAGAARMFIKIMSDETGRKKLEDSLTESNAALEQFAYVASHDLQEPLRTISSYAQLLSRKYKGKLDADADEMLGFVLTASRRMSTLVQDLLAYARAASNERPCSVSLDEDLEAALTHLSQGIEESGAIVTHDPMPVLAVDRSQMVRLFQNLIGNALKYRKPGTRPKVHVGAERNNGEWVVSVRDNGIGFDPEHAHTIFEPFKRLHSETEYSGTGVGLAISKRIVEKHGGRIWAESAPGEGATFRFTLPANKTEVGS